MEAVVTDVDRYLPAVADLLRGRALS